MAREGDDDHRRNTATATATSLDFAVQRAVSPPALWERRAFSIRAHCLVACRGGADASATDAAWLHRSVIVVPCAATLPENDDDDDDAGASIDKAAYVSNFGRGHPPPALTTELPAAHPASHAALWPRLCALARRCLAASAAELLPPPAERCPRSTLYALLALDIVLDASGAPWLVEVNSHPAMGDGTMAAVRPAVYTGLVADVVALLVDGADAAGTGFEPIALPPTPSFP